MTPPRDPDSGKGRVHTDYAGREVTRPGAHVASGEIDTDRDAFADEPTPIREFHRLDQRVRNVEALAVETKIRLENADSLASTEWAKGVDARIASIADDAKAGGDVARAVRRLRAMLWGALGTALAGLGTALWFALGVAKASGVAEGVERERESQRMRDAARLDAVESGHAQLHAELARILGILDGSRPYRAAPYLGPPAPPPHQEP